jgi:diguanylate cyclase
MTHEIFKYMMNINPLVQKEKVNYLYVNSISGIGVTAVVAAILAFGFSSSHLDYKITWCMLLNLVLFARVFSYFKWKEKKDGNQKDLLFFRVGIVLTALIWSGYSLYFYNKSSIYELAVSLVIVSGMAGGATTMMAGDKFSSRIYAFLLIVPFSVRILLDIDSPYRMMGVLGFAFYLVMFLTGEKTAKYISESIELRLKNDELVTSMDAEIKFRIQENKELLQRDVLTGLMNRGVFVEKANSLIKSNQTSNFAVFFVDLNNFKPVNDNLGHKIGDKVLIEVAERLKEFIKVNGLLCRWGGDEFVLVKLFDNKTEVDNISKEISKSMNKEIYINGYQINVGAAIGVSLCPIHGKNIEELISFADMAMYLNKNDKTLSSVVFDFAMSEKVANEFYLSSAVRDSIMKDQLRTFFQPIINSESGEIEGVEALVRWKLNDKFIPPDVFIPLAEKNGFIIDLGYWVLKDALKQIKQIDCYGYNLHVCINVSLIQLQDKNFINNVCEIITAAGINPTRVHMELTESVFSSDKSLIEENVRKLQNFGVKISIDDFGTGYSSLSLVQSLQVDIVKIDKSFVSKIHGSGLDVIKAVLVMSKGFGYDIVAEGVESQEQMVILKELGIKYLQGYFYSKPIPMNELLKWIENKKVSNLIDSN